MRKEEIYNIANGLYGNRRIRGVQNEFFKGRRCALLYKKIYLSRLALQISYSLPPEDDNILNIINAYEDINRIMALKMYNYAKRKYNKKRY